MKTKQTPQTGAELLSMDEAIARLKTTRPTFYRWLKTGKLKGLKAGRQWRFYATDVDRFLKGEALRWDLPADISPLINALAKKAGQPVPATASLSDTERVAAAADLALGAAIALGASDIHLDAAGDQGRIRYRIAGTLTVAAGFDAHLVPPLIDQFKRITGVCRLDIRDLPQDARIPYERGGKAFDIRMAFLPSWTGETMNARLMPRELAVGGLEWLGLREPGSLRLERALAARSGMVVMTGPTGSGKTTALYVAINHVNTPAKKIVAIESEIPYALPGVVQVPVRGEVTFAAALRAALRADPNVIVIGELVDGETVSLAPKAAMTGHLVLSAMHATSAAGAIRRMVEFGASPYDVGESVRLVTSQRIVRKLCPDCRVKDTPSADQLAWAQQAATGGGLDWKALPRKFMKSTGCAKCGGTGFKGRRVAFEALEVTPAVAKLIREGAADDAIQSLAVKQGMVTMAADGVRAACAGETSLAEVMVETSVS
ncbi:MAG: ATPase, T2SS/T4P/T4SS family [Candidatus Coatesbacteria bacterium]